MCDVAHGVKLLLTTAALGAALVAVHPAAGRADNPGHSLADRFATDEERARERAARAAQARRDAERARREVDQLRSDEADMLARARAEAEARRAEQEQARVEAENADRAQREVEAQRAAEEVHRQAEAERQRRETEAADARRRDEDRRAAEAADRERRRLAEAERAAEEARRAADVRRAEEDARLAADRAAAERRADDERRARLAAEREAEARRIADALRQAEVQRAARGDRQRAPVREETESRSEERPSLAEAPPAAEPRRGWSERLEQHHGPGAPVPATDAARYTVLLLMEPGNRGIRRHNRTADPVLCGERGCWISNGPGQAADHKHPHRALGFFRTWGERAGACSNQLGCVFRGVELGSLPGWLQPVDMRVFRHDRRQGTEISAASECWLEAQRLQCRGGHTGDGYVMWIVPERMAEVAGPLLLEQAVADGLAEPQQAALRWPWTR